MVKFNFEISNPITVSLKDPLIFQIKDRCKYCGNIGMTYMSARLPFMFIDHTNQFQIFEHIFKFFPIVDYFYEAEAPKHFLKLSNFTTVIKPQKFKPRLHKNKGNDNLILNHRVDMLLCKCFKTCWYFNQASVQNKPEIINRKKFK